MVCHTCLLWPSGAPNKVPGSDAVKGIPSLTRRRKAARVERKGGLGVAPKDGEEEEE